MSGPPVVKSYSPVVYWMLLGVGAVVAVGLIYLGWREVDGIQNRYRIRMTVAGLFLGGGAIGIAQKYRRDKEAEDREYALIQRGR